MTIADSRDDVNLLPFAVVVDLSGAERFQPGMAVGFARLICGKNLTSHATSQVLSTHLTLPRECTWRCGPTAAASVRSSEASRPTPRFAARSPNRSRRLRRFCRTRPTRFVPPEPRTSLTWLGCFVRATDPRSGSSSGGGRGRRHGKTRCLWWAPRRLPTRTASATTAVSLEPKRQLRQTWYSLMSK
jgi:hypothetical protein